MKLWKGIKIAGILCSILGGVWTIIQLISWYETHPEAKAVVIITKFLAFLNFKISLWILLAAIIFLYARFSYKENDGSGTKNNKVNNLPKKTPVLTREHYWLLFTLLNSSSRSCNSCRLSEDYQKEFHKSVVDFNILRQELIDDDLVRELLSGLGRYWKLTDKGLEIAKEKYIAINNDNHYK